MKTIAAMILIACSSCATILKGHHNDLYVDSKAPDSSVYADDEYIGKAPVTVSLEANTIHTIMVKSPGYEDNTCHLEPAIGTGWLLADLIIMLPTLELGLLPDIMTGSWNHFDRDHWNVEMFKKAN